MPEHESYRCAVVVFVDVPFGVDQCDADAIAEAAVGRNLRQVQTESGGLIVKTDRGDEQVRVAKVREVGTAVRNGYLWTGPTDQAFRSLRSGEATP